MLNAIGKVYDVVVTSVPRGCGFDFSCGGILISSSYFFHLHEQILKKNVDIGRNTFKASMTLFITADPTLAGRLKSDGLHMSAFETNALINSMMCKKVSQRNGKNENDFNTLDNIIQELILYNY